MTYESPSAVVPTSLGNVTVRTSPERGLYFEIPIKHPTKKSGFTDYIIRGGMMRFEREDRWFEPRPMISRADDPSKEEYFTPKRDKGVWARIYDAVTQDVFNTISNWAKSPSGETLLAQARQDPRWLEIEAAEAEVARINAEIARMVEIRQQAQNRADELRDAYR